ncbi:MAG: BadF/BadG/BcrA/BcrD ATPase family protein [Rhodobacter sp.]|nr:BadF/BadG/BcrA/BcrD ATPase family protein [Rhodobacter sp.]
MENGQSHIVAVDGGGSTCRVAVCSAAGTRLASAQGAAANPATSMDEAVANIRATVDEAWHKADLGRAALADARAYLGLAGVIDGCVAQAVEVSLPMGNVRVTDDRPTNMAGALGRRDGFLAALGTGSFLGRQRGDAQSFVGGWGFWLGDQASGAWIGRAALAAVLEWRDGLLPSSELLAELLAEFGQDPGAIVFYANTAAPPDYARFAPRVFDAAGAGDAAALGILRDGAAYLARALDSLGFRTGDALCLIGGVGPRFAAHLDHRYTGNLIEPQGSALDGAIQLALRMQPGAAP